MSYRDISGLLIKAETSKRGREHKVVKTNDGVAIVLPSFEKSDREGAVNKLVKKAQKKDLDIGAIKPYFSETAGLILYALTPMRAPKTDAKLGTALTL